MRSLRTLRLLLGVSAIGIANLGESAVAQAPASVSDEIQAPITADLQGGLLTRWYWCSQALWRQREDLWSRERFLGSAVVPNIAFEDGSLTLAARDEFFAVRFSGHIRIPVSGNYRFRAASDDGFEMIIGGHRMGHREIDGPQDQTMTVHLMRGLHPFEAFYWQHTGPARCLLWWRPPRGDTELVPPEVFVHRPPSGEATD